MTNKHNIDSVTVLENALLGGSDDARAIRIMAGRFGIIIPVNGTRAQAEKKADELRAEGWITFGDAECNAIPTTTTRFELTLDNEQPDRDNLACAEAKLDKIDELTAQVHTHLAAERAYIAGEARYYE